MLLQPQNVADNIISHYFICPISFATCQNYSLFTVRISAFLTNVLRLILSLSQ